MTRLNELRAITTIFTTLAYAYTYAMVQDKTLKYDNEEWVMNKDGSESRLAVVVELKGPNGEWYEKEVTFFEEPGTYELVQK